MTCKHPDGCPNPVAARGWCGAHYQRWMKTGDAGVARIKRTRPDGSLCVHPGGCPRQPVAQGLCSAHYQRLTNHGDVGAAAIKRVRPTGELCALDGCERPKTHRDWCHTHYERWRVHGDATITLVSRGNQTYLASHKLVYRRKGKASAQVCQHCGGQAQQWAYDHNDPDEQVGPMVVRDEVFELRYSRDPEHYIPLCVPCHMRFDQAVPA